MFFLNFGHGAFEDLGGKVNNSEVEEKVLCFVKTPFGLRGFITNTPYYNHPLFLLVKCNRGEQ